MNEAEIRSEERGKCARIASAEYQYWKDQPPSGPTLIMRVAAMGAAANVCAAIWLGKTPAEHTLDCTTRSAGVMFPHSDALDQIEDLLEGGPE